TRRVRRIEGELGEKPLSRFVSGSDLLQLGNVGGAQMTVIVYSLQVRLVPLPNALKFCGPGLSWLSAFWRRVLQSLANLPLPPLEPRLTGAHRPFLAVLRLGLAPLQPWSVQCLAAAAKPEILPPCRSGSHTSEKR